MRFGRSLASRLVVLGLVQLMLLALAAVVIFIAEGPHGAADPEDQLGRSTMEKLAGVIDQPTPLAEAPRILTSCCSACRCMARAGSSSRAASMARAPV